MSWHECFNVPAVADLSSVAELSCLPAQVDADPRLFRRGAGRVQPMAPAAGARSGTAMTLEKAAVSCGAFSSLKRTSAATCSRSVSVDPIPRTQRGSLSARDVDGFFGASSIERIAAEVAITLQTRRFKSLRPARKPVPVGAMMESNSRHVKKRIPRCVAIDKHYLCGVVPNL